MLVKSHIPQVYAKHNNALMRSGKREEAAKLLADFYSMNEGQLKGFRGFVLINGHKDPQQLIGLTFWDTKQNMDDYYTLDNQLYVTLQEKLKPLVESEVERWDNSIAHIKIW